MKIGKISENVLKRSVIRNINKNKISVYNGAAAGADCAIIMDNKNKKCAITTGYVANESDTIAAEHAILRACNNLAVSGYYPQYVTLTISLPEKWREIKLKDMIKKAANVADELGVEIIGGHTETVVGIEKPVVSVSAMSETLIGGFKSEKKAVAGQSVVMTKWAAMSGSAHIVREHRASLSERLPDFILDDVMELEQFYSVIPEAAVAINSGATCMHDVSDGGIFAALWQIADRDGVGISVDLHKIPIRQESIEVCEFYDINPYKLRSDGAMLIVTDDAKKLIDNLAKENILGTLIGTITDGIERIVVSGDEKRFLEEPRQDEFHNIL